MLQRRHMPLYLVIAWLAIDAAVCALMVGYSGRYRPPFLVQMMAMGQFIAITGWITLGEDGIKPSLAGLVVGGVGWALFVTIRSPFFIDLLSVLGATFAGAVLYGGIFNFPLFIARGDGWRFRFEPGSPARGLLFQFSIREIMVCTVLVSLMAALWSATRPTAALDPGLRPGNWTEEIGPAVIVLVIPWSIWAAFAWARPFHGAMAAALATSFWCIVIHRWLAPSATLSLLIPAVTLIVHLFALQLAGFRLQRRRPRTPMLVEDDPDWERVERWKKLEHSEMKK